MKLFVESLDCDARDRVLGFLSTRPYAAVTPQNDSCGGLFAALLDAAVDAENPARITVPSLELLAVPRELRTLVRGLVRRLWAETPGPTVIVVEADANRAFESSVASGKRLSATLADFYDMASEDPGHVIASMIPDARVVRVSPSSDTLSMADLWGIDKVISVDKAGAGT